MTSEVLQVSVLDPLLLIVYMYNLKENAGGMISKFEEYMKICSAVDSDYAVGYVVQT